ncbi:MAG: tryptophan synthase subunit alpha [Oscillospiraceae bacterium]|nr:tryptophan synthase subunit alpha [Oscillospiraceae bacterium]
MSKLQAAFQNGKVFMAFITCGDPDLQTTAAAVKAAVENGADIIELNIPFSDPTAVDPVIQEANIRALQRGITTDSVFDFVRELRKQITVPLVFSTYANVVFSYGADRFVRTCAEIGVDGLIVPDVPFEERQEFLPQCRKYGVALISMLAVTSRQRVAAIAREAEGFLYLMGCPGTREQELTELMDTVRQNTGIPCVVCLNGTEDYRLKDVATKTDGVAVDTPIVTLMARYGTGSAEPVGAYVRQIKEELRAI